jgi:Ni/Fe-hydrogenase subunit HybB-like protein
MATDSPPIRAGYAAQDPVKPAPWHGLVAWDMFFNGMTTGLFLVAAFGEFVSPELFRPVARIACPIALVFLLADLAMLVLDLGDVWRFHHMLRLFKPQSPMSVGVWSLTVYSLPLAIAALLSILPTSDAGEVIRRIAVILALVPAFLSAAYKGVLLSTSAQPGWKHARWLGGHLTSGAVLMGGAELMVLASLAGPVGAAEMLRPALIALLVVHAIPSALLALEMWPALLRVFARGSHHGAIALGLVLSFLVPLLLLIVSGSPVSLIIATVLILVGSLGTRYVLIQLPHVAS